MASVVIDVDRRQRITVDELFRALRVAVGRHLRTTNNAQQAVDAAFAIFTF